MSLTVGELVTVLEVDDRQFRAGMATVQRNVKKLDGQLGTVSANVTRGFDRIRGGATTLAAQFLRVNPAVAQLGSTLASVGAGGHVAVAAVAGAALIGKAWADASEDVKKFEGALADTAKKLDEIIKKGVLGGNLGLFEMLNEARTKAGELRNQAAPLQAQRDEMLAAPVASRLPWFAKRLEEVEAELNPLLAELSTWERRIQNAERALLEANEPLAEITVSVSSFKDAIADLGPVLERADILAAQAQAEANAAGISAHRKFIGGLPKTTLTRITSDGPGAQAVTKFRDAVERFGDGVKQMVKSTFSTDGLKDIGASLTSAAVTFAAGKLVEGISAVFGSFDTAAKRLATAIEKNTRALQADADFLHELVEQSGFGGMADEFVKGIERALSIMAVGKGGGKNIFEILDEELKKLGLEPSLWTGSFKEQLVGFAKMLGIDVRDEETLKQFLEMLGKAGYGLDGLADEAQRTADALKNVPEGWKVAQAMFNATQGVATGAAGVTGTAVVLNYYGDVRVDASGMTAAEIVPAVERELARLAARGRPVAMPRGLGGR